MTKKSSRTTKQASSKKTKRETPIPSVDDILKDADARRKRKASLMDVWEQDNPEKAARFWDAVNACREQGGSVEAVFHVCQARLGGPPGSVSTLRKSVYERDAKNRRTDD